MVEWRETDRGSTCNDEGVIALGVIGVGAALHLEAVSGISLDVNVRGEIAVDVPGKASL